MSERVQLLDAVIDLAAERSFAKLAPESIAARAGLVAGDVEDAFSDSPALTAAAIDRLFERRMGEYREALETVDGSRASTGIEALAGVFPTRLWVAYWNILFSTRADLPLRERLLDITDTWEEEILATFPRFLPPGLPDEKVMFFAVQMDALGMATLTIGAGWDRASHVERLVGLWEDEPDDGASSREVDEALAGLLPEFQVGEGPAEAWLASHDLFFARLGSSAEADLKPREAQRRMRLEGEVRRAFDPEISAAAAQLAICHLDGLATGSMFVRSIDDLGVPGQLALLGDEIRRLSDDQRRGDDV